MGNETFTCLWCIEAGLTVAEATFDKDDVGGTDATTDEPICQDCADAAWEAGRE